MGLIRNYVGKVKRIRRQERAFNIDIQPSFEQHGENLLRGWALDSSEKPVALELALNGTPLFQTICRHPRIDVYKIYPKSPSNALSGFEIRFPEHSSNLLRSGRLELRAHFCSGLETIWQREGEGQQENQAAGLALLGNHFESQRQSDPTVEIINQRREEDHGYRLHVVFQSRGRYSEFVECVESLEQVLSGEVIDSARAVSVSVVLADDADCESYKKALVERLSQYELPIGIVSRASVVSYDSLLGRLKGDRSSSLVLFVDESADIGFVDWSKFLAAYRENRRIAVLMPTLYNSGGVLTPPAGLHLKELYDRWRHREDKVPACVITRTPGPVWLTELRLLEKLDNAGRPRSGYLLSEGVCCHCDLRQGIVSHNGDELSLSDLDKLEVSYTIAHDFEESVLAFNGKGTALFLISPDWKPEDWKGGWQYQIVEYARRLSDEGLRVIFVEDDDRPAGKIVDGHIALPLERIAERSRELGQEGWIIATDWRTVRAAWALRYLCGMRVANFIQRLDYLTFEKSGRENLETAAWAVRGDFLPITTTPWVAEKLSEVSDTAAQCLSQRPVINRRVFFPQPIKRRPKGIAFILGRQAGDTGEESSLCLRLASALRQGAPDVFITVAGYQPLRCPQQLLDVADSCFSRLDPADRAHLFSSHEIFCELSQHNGFDVTLLEAASCGAVVASFDATGSSIVLGKDSMLALDAGDVEGASQELLKLLGAPDRCTQMRAKALKLVESLAPKNKESAYDLMNRNWQSIAESLSIERSKPRKVSVIVPVYGALDSTMMCVRSFLNYAPEDFELVIVNDCSDAGTTEWLRSFAAANERVKLVDLAKNMGFIQACWAGLRASDPFNDIVLLNSDVVLSRRALELLREAVYSNYDIGLASGICTNSSHLQLDVNTGDSLESAAAKVLKVHKPNRPTVVTPEGHLLYIRRWALDKFGFFDPVFNRGFCEESDMCMRMFLNGADMISADNALVFHRRSASFGKEERNKLYWENRPVFDSRWLRYYSLVYPEFLRRNPLGPLRTSYKALAPVLQTPTGVVPTENLLSQLTQSSELAKKRVSTSVLDGVDVVFVLPSVILGGGTLSVLQHVNEMLMRGIEARVVTFTEPDVGDYPLLAPPIAVSPEQFFELNWTDQHVVATFWVTAYFVKNLTYRYPGLKAFYYIQDYEPWFYSYPDRFRTVKEAMMSYSLGLKCAAKTQYLKEIVGREHGVPVELIEPGLDHGVFYPGRQDEHVGRPRITAYYRPRTARRGGRECMELLRALLKRMPEVTVNLFGEDAEIPEDLRPSINTLGRQAPAGVGRVYRESDVVIDLSYWHGFGRMGIEGMACGAVPLLSESGGIQRYARDGENCFIVHIDDLDGAVERLIVLLKERELRLKMRDCALETSRLFSEFQAADDWIRVLGLADRMKSGREWKPFAVSAECLAKDNIEVVKDEMPGAHESQVVVTEKPEDGRRHPVNGPA